MGHEKAPLIIFNLLGTEIRISESIVVQWGIILLLAIISIILTSNLKRIPNKVQVVLEMFYETVEKVVTENMGEKFKSFIPFIGTLALYLVFMNITALIGVPAPTEDLSVTIGMAAVSFLVIQGYAIKKVGISGYFKGLFHPLAIIFPLNIIERIMLPVSLSLRLFGNIAAGAVIMKIVYDNLGNVTPILNIGIPIPFHFYFDLFDGVIQMIIFLMLTMINIKIVSEH